MNGFEENKREEDIHFSVLYPKIIEYIEISDWELPNLEQLYDKYPAFRGFRCYINQSLLEDQYQSSLTLFTL